MRAEPGRSLVSLEKRSCRESARRRGAVTSLIGALTCSAGLTSVSLHGRLSSLRSFFPLLAEFVPIFRCASPNDSDSYQTSQLLMMTSRARLVSCTVVTNDDG